MLKLPSFLTSKSLLKDTVKKRNIYAYLIVIISQFLYAIEKIQLKTFKILFQNHFSTQSVIFWRSLSHLLISYFSIVKKGQSIKKLSDIRYKFWFIFSKLGMHFSIILWLKELTYFHASSIQSIINCSPIVFTILSCLFFKQTFYARYALDILLSLIGTIMVVLNEKYEEDNDLEKKILPDFCVRISIAIGHLVFLAFLNIGQRKIMLEKMSFEIHQYYLGLFGVIPAFIFILIEKNACLVNVWYVLYTLSNGIITYLANYFMAEALKITEIKKFIVINYLNIVFIFIFGFLTLGEKIFFNEIIGNTIIIGFNIYNFYYPAKKLNKIE